MDMTIPTVAMAHSPAPFRLRLLESLLGAPASGSLRVDHDGKALLHLEGPMSGPRAHVRLHRKRAVMRALVGGENGAAQAFVDGDWSSPDMVETCRYFARNPAGLDCTPLGTPRRWLDRLRHGFNANTRSGSRRNIEFHYDLGNAFYRHWLGESMAYSSALWLAPHESLEQAQHNKLRRVVELLGEVRGRTVLEIGCGWGAQACTLAHHGAQVKGITLSPAQLDYAREAVAAAGLGDRVRLALEDYRDQAGSFDHIVSIEMAEAVGEANLPVYFETIRRNLKPGGTAVLQVITIAGDRFEQYRRQPDFIQRHIFPGGFLPTKALLADMARGAGLKSAHTENFGASYATTLAHWRQRFEAAWPQIAQLGFDDRFRRLWNYYLSYCEAGFREECIDVSLFSFTR